MCSFAVYSARVRYGHCKRLEGNRPLRSPRAGARPCPYKQMSIFNPFAVYQVKFTKSNQVGPINILVVWNASDERHWFFVTSFDDYKTAPKWYRKRFTIETLFSDLKGRGFNLDETRLWKPERVSRLIFVAAIAYVFTVFLGVESIISGIYHRLVRTDDYYHSLFRGASGRGLIYLDHLLNEALDFPPLWALPPPDSFDHGYS